MKFNINPNCRKLIEEGVCKADCCGVVPFNYQIFQQIKHSAYTKDYKIEKFNHSGTTYCIAITKDLKCIFLNKEDYTCTIYNSPRKPDLCRIFGTIDNEPLAACLHINKDKEDIICKTVDANVLDKVHSKGETKHEQV